MRLKILILSIVTFMFFLSGCVEVSVVSDDNYEMYSRKDTETMALSDSFGKNKSDDIYVALDYMYSNEEMQEIFGADFEITEEDVICHKSETQTQFFLNRIKGVAEYSFAISDVRYRIKLSKEYKEKWKVVFCELEADE